MVPLNPHETPPQDMKDVFKKYQKIKPDVLIEDVDVVDFQVHANPHAGRFECARSIPSAQLKHVFGRFTGDDENVIYPQVSVYCSLDLPGLLVLPALLPPSVQKKLLSNLMHRDLSDPKHKTNLDFHHIIARPETTPKDEQEAASFFSFSPKSPAQFQPKDSSAHKPLSIKQILEKKLRWVTLGGQYDWTNKVYPQEQPPSFPPDIASLVGDLFTDMRAEAAIVNLYSPGDTLSLHRDVSEEVDRGLVSISLGCECLFIIGLAANSERPEEASRFTVVRLRSGDAVYMSKDARFAWHGVPKIISDTCPDYLADWPAETGNGFGAWRGWMSNKRINLNIRQMRE